MTTINLNFAGIPDDTSGPLPEGPTVVRILEAELYPAKSADKSPSIKLKLGMADPSNTRTLNTWVSLSQKDYPRQQMKKFFESVYQVPLNSEVEIKLQELVGQTVIAIIGLDKSVDWQKKDENGNPVGEPTKRDFNKVTGWLPYVV